MPLTGKKRKTVHPRPRRVSAARRGQVIRRLKVLLRGRPEILFALLHGSFLAGGSFRDVDIALYVDPRGLGSAALRDYECDLGIRLSESLGAPVDVRLLNDAPLAFRYHALKGEVLLAGEADFLDDFRARTWDDYCDFAPFAKRYLREAIGA